VLESSVRVISHPIENSDVPIPLFTSRFDTDIIYIETG